MASFFDKILHKNNATEYSKNQRTRDHSEPGTNVPDPRQHKIIIINRNLMDPFKVFRRSIWTGVH